MESSREKVASFKIPLSREERKKLHEFAKDRGMTVQGLLAFLVRREMARGRLWKD